jgi:hypothetical protein
MNFKTTITLLILLAIGGGALYLARGKSETPVAPPSEAHLLDISSGDVSHLAITTDDGQHIIAEKSNGKWQLTEPVKTPAEESTVSSVIETISSLQSRGQVDLASAGVSQPHFKVELTAKNNKTINLDIGDRSAAGDNLYVRVNNGDKAEVIPAALYDQLDKPLKSWRREKLFDVGSPEIKQLRIATTQQTLTLQKEGENWKITQPTSMPVETSEVSDIAISAANLRATDFISENSSDAKRYGLDQPAVTVSFSTQSPTTQPSTQPSFTTVQFGRFDDVMRKNVYAMSSEAPGIVTVAASAVDSFRKTPLDLRDKNLLSVDPAHVTQIKIERETAATTKPTTKPASHQTISIERRKISTTSPATSQSATQSRWKLANGDVNDMKVEQMLNQFHPLHVTKYLSSIPAGKPSLTFTITIDTTDADYEIRLIDIAGELSLVGSYNGLTFEMPRAILQQIEGDFVKKPNATNEAAGEKVDSVGEPN